MSKDQFNVSPEEIKAVQALMAEYQLACATHPVRGFGGRHVELTVVPEFLKKWAPLAKAETDTYRPHQIACGMILNRVKAYFDNGHQN